MKFLNFLYKRPISIIAIFSVFIVFGLISFSKLKISLLPEIVYPKLTIVTQYENVPPKEIEELVSIPVEEAILSVNGVKRVESISKESYSIVVATFDWGTDIDIASVDIREKIDSIKNNLPKEIKKSVVLKLDPNSAPVIGIGITWNTGDYGSVRRLIEKEIKPEFERQDGIAKVSLKGGQKEEIHIDIDLEKMNSYKIPLEKIKKSISESSYNFPAGNIVEGKKEFLIRVDGEFKTINDINNTVITDSKSGGAVRVKDIAAVKFGYKDRTSYFLFNDNEGIGIDIIKESGANDIEISKNVKSLVDDINKRYDGFIKLEVLSDSSNFIKNSINNLTISAICAILITFFSIFFFLRNLNISFIISLSIPLSILFLFLTMYFMNISLNIISLGGIIFGIGMVVDNSIVVIEEIEGKQTTGEIAGAVSKLIVPIISSSLTTTIIFLPIIFVKGIVREVFIQLGITIAFAIIFSIFIAIFLTPVLFILLAKNTKIREVLLDKISSPMIKALKGFFSRKRFVVLLFPVCIIIMALIFMNIKKEFMPGVDKGEFAINVLSPNGTPIEESRKIVNTIANELKRSDEVKSVYSSIGYEEDDLYSILQEEVGENISSVKVLLKDKRRHSVFEFVDNFNKNFKFREDVKVVYEIPQNLLVDLLQMAKYDFYVEVYADQADKLDDYSNELFDNLKKSSTISDLEISKKPGRPQIKVNFDYESLSNSGVTSQSIYDIIFTAVKGTKVTDYKKEDDRLNLIVRFDKKDRKDISDFDRINLFIESNDNNDTVTSIPITSFIKIGNDKSYSKILRKNQKEYIKLFGNYTDKNSKDKSDSILNEYLKKHPDITVSRGDESREMEESFKQLLLAFLLSIFLVFVLLSSQFESFVISMLIITSIPFSLFGALLALFITGQSLNINSILGIIMLSGIVVNNGILLFDKYLKDTTDRDLKSVILGGTEARIKPVFMTTMTTIVGLIPMLFSFNRSGNLETPLAIAVIGGLITSTLMTLLFMPVLYYMTKKEKS
jgi:multidrug efflux pump subunit AcrB